MKFNKSIVVPVLLSMFLASCGEVSPVVEQKASIKIEKNEYITTSLTEGKYDINKSIEFTVSVINEEYTLGSVSMNEEVLTPVNGDKYSFTPKEAKEYTLKVVTNEDKYVVVYDFSTLKADTYVQQLTKKGTRLNIDNSGADFEDLVKDGKLTLKSGQRLVFLCNDSTFGVERVMFRKISFTFTSGKDNLTLASTGTSEYADGVWTSKETESDEGDTTILFMATGDVTISKIVGNTSQRKETTSKIEFTNKDADEEVYVLDGPTFFDYKKKEQYKADKEFVTGQAYYFVVEWNENHKFFSSGLTLYYKESILKVHTFSLEDDAGQPTGVIVTCYEHRPVKEDGKINTINCVWAPSEATKSIKVDITSANKYVKNFMETDPINSLGLNDLVYGGNASVNLKAKRGYYDLKMKINGEPVTKDEDKNLYTFKVPFTKEITVSFSATEGDEEALDKDVIHLIGDLKDKGVFYAAEMNGQIYIMFYPAEEHPTCTISTLKFNNSDFLERKEFKEEDQDARYYYLLSADQTSIYKAASDKDALFEATVTESASYDSFIYINKGDYTLAVGSTEGEDEGNQLKFKAFGTTSVTVKITLNEGRDLHSIEMNDRRLTSEEYTRDSEGNYYVTFNANAKRYDFLIQTIAQTVTLELDKNSTKGYTIKDLPTSPVECCKPITLTLGVTSDSYWLEGKTIKVFYNDAAVAVNLSDFTFQIIPLKGISKILVVVS